MAPAQTFDICIYGATASGILAAVAAARRGCTVVVIEPSRWLGGMIGGGIRITTDCEYPNHVGGTTRELLLHERTFNVWNHDGGQRQLREMWRHLIDRHEIPVIFEHRVAQVVRSGRSIDQLVLDYAPPQPDGAPAPQAIKAAAKTVSAKVFIDAGYEGDLLAMAGVSYTVGRESRREFNESLAGVRHVQPFADVDPYQRPGLSGSGLLSQIPGDPLGCEGDASRYMIPFNFRFDRELQRTGGGTSAQPPNDVTSDHAELVGRVHRAGHLGPIRGNFNRLSLLDGTIPGIQAGYPDGDWATRNHIWRTIAEHDRLVAQVTGVKLGLSRDMYPDTDGWPHQLYIRMARRMRGPYIMTQADLALQTTVPDSVGLGYYNVDIYPCRLVALESGVLATEGETWELISPGPYPIPYRAMTPASQACSNLLVSVCISASHVACASIRMEPTFMVLGESAGIAAALAIEQRTDVQRLNYECLRSALLDAGQILRWNGEGYGAHWFGTPFEAWWLKHPEEYRLKPVPA